MGLIRFFLSFLPSLPNYESGLTIDEHENKDGIIIIYIRGCILNADGKRVNYKTTEHGDRTGECMQAEGEEKMTIESGGQRTMDSPSLGGRSMFFFLVLLPLGRPLGLFPG